MAIEIAHASDTARILYPESDGQPMAENTKQYNWIEKIKGGCEALFLEHPDVFVAGDLFWYPVEGHPEIRFAPDTMVVFGRTKGDRGSYKQWEEDRIAPQVVFEVLSPGNRPGEMLSKFLFYNRYGVEEYYIYDPDRSDLTIALRQQAGLEVVPFTGTFVSPRMGVRFELPEGATELVLYRPDGRRFLSFTETEQERAAAEARAQTESERAARLAERLRELGVDPDSL
jgi:Uma2 family endonuclease